MDLTRVWTGRERSLWLKRELGPGTNHSGICEGDWWTADGETESRRLTEGEGEGEGEGQGDSCAW